MKQFVGSLFLCIASALCGCASNYGVAEIRYSEYSRPYDLPPNEFLENARSQPSTRTLYVEGRVVDEFCESFQWRVDEKDKVTAPESVVGAVVVVPRREHPASGRILQLYPSGIEFIGILYRNGDWGRIGTSFSWTEELVSAWENLLDQAHEGNAE